MSQGITVPVSSTCLGTFTYRLDGLTKPARLMLPSGILLAGVTSTAERENGKKGEGMTVESNI